VWRRFVNLAERLASSSTVGVSMSRIRAYRRANRSFWITSATASIVSNGCESESADLAMYFTFRGIHKLASVDFVLLRPVTDGFSIPQTGGEDQ